MKVTLKDIAKATGVDVVSISYTLRNHPRAAELRSETRKKIVRAAQELGYQRNELAASIRTGSTRTVAVLGRFDQLQTADYDSAVLGGIIIEASQLNYGIKIYPVENLENSFAQILSHQIKHVISMSIEKDQREKIAELCRQHELKLIYIYEDSHEEFPAVNSANHDGALNAVKYLLDVGHRQIALICSRHDHIYKKEHHAGYLKALTDYGIKPLPELICCENDVEVIEQQISRMLKIPETARPTAFYCISDSLAMLVERVVINSGFKIPEDISVIGYGNSLLAKCAVTPLTSMEQSFGKLGKTALRVLLGNKTSIVPTANNRYLVPVQLIKRLSVAEKK
jgi:LacI family transcriptional regulator